MIDNTGNTDFLAHTFLHFKGIGVKKEHDFWEEGIRTWDDVASKYCDNQLCLFNREYDSPFLKSIDDARQALLLKDADFFAFRLPNREYYRISQCFIEQTVFLDIETTGLSKYYDYITIVGWSVKGKYKFYIKGDDDRELRQDLSDAKCIITFNGSLFDLPFIKQEFPGINLPKAHVDLRFLSRRVGLSGGQKIVENKLGIQRPKDVEDVEGRIAPILWYRFCRGDNESLKKLLKYNYLDIVGMQNIYNEVVKRLIQNEKIPYDDIFQFKSNTTSFNIDRQESYFLDKYMYIKKLHSKISLEIIINSNTISLHNLRIAGIDLTGSEKRASGFCFLEGKVATTTLVKSDKDIINETLKIKPTIISIDSPLSLPRGRHVVTDDDPGRDEYGIIRFCERILKKRGVNVYPSLIKSMQGLTQRGIKLADHFRSLGYPVIESFPGAAQDILRIPRKRTDIDLLKYGLIEFGIEGPFRDNGVSHDELDAITSALVGYFFWFGKFEALGNFEEEYLIIPDTTIDRSKWLKRKVIGISGPIATGKTTAGEHIASKGFHYARFSKVIEGILENRGMEVNNESLQAIGFEIKRNGQRWLCKQLVEFLPEDEHVVIDGIRHPEDHAFLVETFGPSFTHIYIDSPVDQCEDRYVKRGYSREDFTKAINHPVEENVKKLPGLANLKLSNCGTLDDFIINIDSITDTITN